MPDTMDKQQTKQSTRGVESFLGGTPGRVVVRLILMSLVVGFLMSVFGISPQAIVEAIERFIASIYDNSFEVLRSGFGYLLTGAVIVLPLWFLGRLMAAGRRR